MVSQEQSVLLETKELKDQPDQQEQQASTDPEVLPDSSDQLASQGSEVNQDQSELPVPQEKTETLAQLAQPETPDHVELKENEEWEEDLEFQD